MDYNNNTFIIDSWNISGIAKDSSASKEALVKPAVRRHEGGEALLEIVIFHKVSYLFFITST